MNAEEVVGRESLKVRLREYFQELGIEWKKITFPEHKPWPFTKRGWHRVELYRATITVFVFTAIFAFILSALDSIMTQIFKAIFG